MNVHKCVYVLSGVSDDASNEGILRIFYDAVFQFMSGL